MNTLFVMEKWCDGNPQMGLTNNFHNLIGTFQNCVSSNIAIAHLDECARTGNDINKIIPQAVSQLNIDTVIVSHLGQSPINPSVECLNSLPDHARLIVIWPDIGYTWADDRMRSLSNALHVSWAGETPTKGVRKFISLWTPEDEKLYFPTIQSLDISFIGSMRQERIEYLRFLLNNNIKVNISGGQREHKLTAEQYAQLIRESKINLNFPGSPIGEDQFKGRCLETIASKSLLLERKNSTTTKYLTPGVHYIEFDNPNDLMEKIKYYLNNDKEREIIATSGYEKFNQSYSAKLFWQKVLENV